MMARRIWWLIFFLFLLGLLIILRLLHLQVVDYNHLRKKSLRQTQNSLTLPARRGNIYDRNDNLLAASSDYFSVYVIPPHMTASFNVTQLAQILEIAPATVSEKISQPLQFVWLKRQISPTQKEKLSDLKIKGLYFIPEHKRLYLRNSLAGQVLGFVGLDGLGLGGVEYRFEEELRGDNGYLITERDAYGHEIFSGSRVLKESTPGLSLKLTLDETLQYLVEKELANTVIQSKATWGCVIMSDVATGQILSMASFPFFNPEKFSQYQAFQKNLAIQTIYEPGSTLKLATIAAVLEEGLVTPLSRYDNPYSLEIEGETIREANQDPDHQGVKTVSDIIVHSLNIGSVKMGAMLGKEKLYSYLKKFRLGQKTGIALPGESGGILEKPEKWTAIDFATIPFGQGIAITPLQLLGFVSSIGNDGVYMAPRIIDQISLKTQGLSAAQWVPSQISRGERIMSARTAWELRKMMYAAVDHGTGVAAQIQGYSIGGKTGTAQKINPLTKHYDVNRYVASFVGLAPIQRPRIAVVVVIDSPQTSIYGSNIAAPTFRKIVSEAMRLLAIPPDKP
jgi:cell division protein FtsI (penicillin-binding protein 3)